MEWKIYRKPSLFDIFLPSNNVKLPTDFPFKQFRRLKVLGGKSRRKMVGDGYPQTYGKISHVSRKSNDHHLGLLISQVTLWYTNITMENHHF